jgi:hypothetical protein
MSSAWNATAPNCLLLREGYPQSGRGDTGSFDSVCMSADGSLKRIVTIPREVGILFRSAPIAQLERACLVQSSNELKMERAPSRSLR